MPQFITFFPRQMVMGNAGSSGEIYSEVYDVSDANEMDFSLRLHAVSGSSAPADEALCTVTVEETNDPSFSDANWSNYATVTESGINTKKSSVGTQPERFIRAKMQIEPEAVMIVSFQGRAEC